MLAVPAILGLTLTLCVVDNQADAGTDAGCGESGAEKELEDEDEERRRLVHGEQGEGEEEQEEGERADVERRKARWSDGRDSESEEDGENMTARRGQRGEERGRRGRVVDRIGNTMHSRLIELGEDPSHHHQESQHHDDHGGSLSTSSSTLLPLYDGPHEFQHHPSPDCVVERRGRAGAGAGVSQREAAAASVERGEHRVGGRVESEADEALVALALEEEMRREEVEKDTTHVLKFNKWLTAVQCARKSPFHICFSSLGKRLSWVGSDWIWIGIPWIG